MIPGCQLRRDAYARDHRSFQRHHRRWLVWNSIVGWQSWHSSPHVFITDRPRTSLLASCATMLILGQLYTYFAMKEIFMGSMLLFIIGSTVSATAQSSPAFIVGRALSGMGSAGVFAGGSMSVSPLTRCHDKYPILKQTTPASRQIQPHSSTAQSIKRWPAAWNAYPPPLDPSSAAPLLNTGLGAVPSTS